MTTPTTETLAADAHGLARAAGILRQGGRVAFPTETVYGLGADARNDRAVAGVFEAKNRPAYNPLIVHVADLAAAERLVTFSDPARRLARAFWPGPLTVVLPQAANTGISGLVSAGLPTLAIRVPHGEVAQALLRAFEGPIAAPSANLSGQVSPTTARHVLDTMSGRIEAVVDGGRCRVGVESTIIGFDDATPILLRPGGLPVEDIEACLGENHRAHTGRKVTAPGQLASHYAPRAKLRLNAATPRPDEAWLGFGEYPSRAPTVNLNLSENRDLREAAANLFSHLRQLDDMAAQSRIPTIAVAIIPQTGLGRAINDRLKRASAPRSGAPALG